MQTENVKRDTKKCAKKVLDFLEENTNKKRYVDYGEGNLLLYNPKKCDVTIINAEDVEPIYDPIKFFKTVKVPKKKEPLAILYKYQTREWYDQIENKIQIPVSFDDVDKNIIESGKLTRENLNELRKTGKYHINPIVVSTYDKLKIPFCDEFFEKERIDKTLSNLLWVDEKLYDEIEKLRKEKIK